MEKVISIQWAHSFDFTILKEAWRKLKRGAYFVWNQFCVVVDVILVPTPAEDYMREQKVRVIRMSNIML